MNNKPLLFFILLIIAAPVQAQWISTNGPVNGGTVRSMLADGTMIFCGNNGGVHRSSDNGDTWVPVNNGLPSGVLGVLDLVRNGNNLYAGTNMNGANISTNNGNIWTNIQNGIPVAYTEAFAVSGTKLFNATFSAGVWTSTDNGVSWSHSPFFNGNNIVCFEVRNDTIYAGSEEDGIYISYDGGDNFINSSTGIPANTGVESVVLIGSLVFGGTSGAGVYVSADHGATWTAVNNGLLPASIHDLVSSGTALFASSTSGVYITTDFGASWNAINDGLVTTQNLYVTEMAVNSTHIFIGTVAAGGGVWKRELTEVIGVEENAAHQTAILFFPNPASDFINIQSEKSIRNTSITIFNPAGTIVKTLVAGKELPREMDVRDLSTGMYFIRVQSEDRRWFSKIVTE